MSRSRCLLPIVLLIGLLTASLAANVWLWQRNQEYYYAMNHIRLDPLGLQSYANAPERATEQPTIVFFGDSRAQEWPAAPDMPELRFINRGIGAQTTAQVSGRYMQDVHSLEPKLIIIQVGINDLKTIALFPDQKNKIIADCIATIKQIVYEAKNDGSRVVLTTIFPTRAPSLERRIYWSDEIAAAIREVNAAILAMQSEHVLVIDAAALLSDQQGLLRTDLSKDMLHLNADGYALLNRELVKIIGSQMPFISSR